MKYRDSIMDISTYLLYNINENFIKHRKGLHDFHNYEYCQRFSTWVGIYQIKVKVIKMVKNIFYLSNVKKEI